MKNRALLLCVAGILPLGSANAETSIYSPNLTGVTGLNVMPNARMNDTGSIIVGTSYLKPYSHGFLGFQLADSLQINLRQTAEVSNLYDNAQRLYPGVDTKLRILRETEFLPEVAIGLNGAIGHQRMSSEYLALSKRYGNFDFTGGLGWGRMGSAAHIKNPLKAFSSHFGKMRANNSEMAATPEQWFTGQNAAFFAGLEYFTPIEGLSLKADWGGDNYAAETIAINDLSAGAPWSIGFNYSPKSWISASLAMQGTDSVMGRINFKSTPEKWPFNRNNKDDNLTMQAVRPNPPLPPNDTIQAKDYDTQLYSIRQQEARSFAALELNPHETSPAQLKRAAITLADHMPENVEHFSLRPTLYNFKGPLINLNRRDLENALAHNSGSAEEIWHSAEISPDDAKIVKAWNRDKPSFLHFVLDNKFSLSEEDSGILYRTSLVGHYISPSFLGLLHSGTSLRANIADNLHEISDIRPFTPLPVRSNEGQFADQLLGLERSYMTATASLTPEIHTALSAGYLEEMYGGFGGEILYRPFGKRFAIGAESWIAMKRDPLSTLNLGFNGDSLLTGHLNGWYEFPAQNLTLQARFGRYLAEDIGGSLSLKRRFQNGAELEGFITLSEMADIDPFGGTTHAYNGIRLSLPLGSAPFIPSGSKIQNTFAPLGRDYGQSLHSPMPLYETTDALSYSHIARNWHDITSK